MFSKVARARVRDVRSVKYPTSENEGQESVLPTHKPPANLVEGGRAARLASPAPDGGVWPFSQNGSPSGEGEIDGDEEDACGRGLSSPSRSGGASKPLNRVNRS